MFDAQRRVHASWFSLMIKRNICKDILKIRWYNLQEFLL
jgi:hypothetical protein